MISNKRIFLISVMVLVIIAAIAVMPGHHRLVSPVHASNWAQTYPGSVIILRCSFDPGASGVVYSQEAADVGGPSTFGYVVGEQVAILNQDPCSYAISEILGQGYVISTSGTVLAARVEGDRQISTWMFTTGAVTASN